jgi:hypothetical protein
MASSITYRTGRTRTITCTCVVNAYEVFYAVGNLVPPIVIGGYVGPGVAYGQSTGSVKLLGCTLSFTPYYAAVGSPFVTGYNIGMTCEASIGSGGLTLDSGPQTSYSYYPLISGAVDVNFSIVDGSITVSADVEEMVTVTFGDYPMMNLGTQLIDPPVPTSITFFERYKIGGTISASISCGASASVSGTITAANPVGGYDITRYESINVARTSAAIDINATYLDLDWEPPFSLTDTETATGHTYSATAYVGGTDMSITITADSDTGGSGVFTTTVSPPVQFNLFGQIMAISDLYPDNLTLTAITNAFDSGTTISISGGTFSSPTYIQTFQQVGIPFQLNGNEEPLPTTIDNFGVISWVMQASALSALAEDTSLTRILGRGFLWNAMTVGQAASVNADPGAQAANWTAGAHTTLSNATGTTMNIAVAGGTGSLTSTLPSASGSLKGTNWNGVSFQGYRTLRLYLTCTTAEAAVITLGTKKWNVTVPTSGYVEIDLCHPSNNSAISDLTDSVWPYSAPPYSVTDGPLWGVTNVSSLSISGLVSGYTYTLGLIELIRKDHATLSFLSTYKGWIQAFPAATVGSVTTTTYYRRARQGDTDGRQSLEGTDCVWLHETSSGSPVDAYADATIAAVIAGLASGNVPPSDGWTAADLQPDPNIATPGTCTGGGSDELLCLTNSGYSSTALYGSGLIWNGTAWVSGIGIDVTGTATIPAQTLFDTISLYPDCGDVFQLTSGAFGAVTAIALGAIYRGNSWGLAFNATTPDSGDAVTLTEIDNSATVGTATSNTIGQYNYSTSRMGSALPYGKGLKAIKTATSILSNAISATRTFFSRRRHRTCFSLTVPFPPPTLTQGGVDILCYKVGYYVIYINGSGGLEIERTWQANAPFDFTAVVDSAMDCVEPHICAQSWTGLLSVVYIRGDGTDTPFYMCRSISADYGATWVTQATFAGGANGVRHVNERYNDISGERFVFYNDMSILDGSGNPTGQGYIWCKVYDRTETEVSGSPFEVDSTNYSDDASFGVDYVPGSPLAMDLVYPIMGTPTRYRSTDNGRSWTPL